MTIDTSRNTDEVPIPRRSRYLTPVLLLLTALALNAVCFGAVLLTAQSPPGPPDAPTPVRRPSWSGRRPRVRTVSR